ncbi:hypothetical protein XaFJ1_GM003159 [Xanthomonas albilineans]|nr:hypothetical protein XaFJ1_GM003159 [Xanthomonas albilineans]
MTRAAPMLLPDAALAALRSQWRLHRGAC